MARDAPSLSYRARAGQVTLSEASSLSSQQYDADPLLCDYENMASEPLLGLAG